MHKRLNFGLGWLWLFIILVICFHKPVLKSFFILNYQDSILSVSRKYAIQPDLLSAVIFVESRFQPEAKSSKGALGLMQIMPATGKWISNQLEWQHFEESDLLDPKKNITLGTWYLSYLTRYFKGNQTAGLAAYNAGHRYVRGWMNSKVWDGDLVKIESIPFSETKQYLFQINMLTKIYRYLYPELKETNKEIKTTTDKETGTTSKLIKVRKPKAKFVFRWDNH